MAIPRPPAYAELWRLRRGPRQKPSGLSALFEKIDADLRDYDRTALQAAGTPGKPGAAAAASIGRLQAALDAVTRQVRRYRPGFDVAERMAIHRFMDDVNEEIAFWRSQSAASPPASDKAGSTPEGSPDSAPMGWGGDSGLPTLP